MPKSKKGPGKPEPAEDTRSSMRTLTLRALRSKLRKSSKALVEKRPDPRRATARTDALAA